MIYPDRETSIPATYSNTKDLAADLFGEATFRGAPPGAPVVNYLPHRNQEVSVTNGRAGVSPAEALSALTPLSPPDWQPKRELGVVPADVTAVAEQQTDFPKVSDLLRQGMNQSGAMPIRGNLMQQEVLVDCFGNIVQAGPAVGLCALGYIGFGAAVNTSHNPTESLRSNDLLEQVRKVTGKRLDQIFVYQNPNDPTSPVVPVVDYIANRNDVGTPPWVIARELKSLGL